jgi:hypothetical protein
MIKLTDFLWRYLKDWKNLLAHALVGVLILVVGLYLPVKPAYRILLMIAIIVLNTYRMKRSESKKVDTEEGIRE